MTPIAQKYLKRGLPNSHVQINLLASMLASKEINDPCVIVANGGAIQIMQRIKAAGYTCGLAFYDVVETPVA